MPLGFEPKAQSQRPDKIDQDLHRRNIPCVDIGRSTVERPTWATDPVCYMGHYGSDMPRSAERNLFRTSGTLQHLDDRREAIQLVIRH